MNDFQAQISKLVDQFVAQVTTVAREAATQMLQAALGAANDVATRLRPGASPASSPTASVSTRAGRTPVAAASTARRKGVKRASNEIESLRQRLVDFVRRHPGLRVEQINQQLGTTTRDVALPLRKLVADGVIRSEGEKRSTKYYPAVAAAAAPAAPVAPLRRNRA